MMCKEDVDEFEKDGMTFSKNEKSVKFSDLEIRSYPYRIGNHPDCIRGVPLSIEWKYFDKHLTSIDDYEDTHPPRRQIVNLIIPAPERKRILLSTGYSVHDIHEAMLEASKSRQQRRLTIALAELKTIEAILDFWERCKRKLFSRRKH